MIQLFAGAMTQLRFRPPLSGPSRTSLSGPHFTSLTTGGSLTGAYLYRYHVFASVLVSGDGLFYQSRATSRGPWPGAHSRKTHSNDRSAVSVTTYTAPRARP